MAVDRGEIYHGMADYPEDESVLYDRFDKKYAAKMDVE